MASIRCKRCGTENDPEQDRWYYCAKCGDSLRFTETAKRVSALQPEIRIHRRIYRGGGFEANAFLVIGCLAFLLAAWLVYQACTPHPGMISVAPYLLFGALASVAGGVFLVFLFVKRRGLSVEVGSDAVIVRDGNQITESMPAAEIVNFFSLAARDLMNRPSLTRPRSHWLIGRSRQMRIPDGIGDEAALCEHIAGLLCALHLDSLRNAVAQGSYPIAEKVVITPTGVWDAQNSGDGLAWDELEFDTGGDPDDDDKLRLWKRGAMFTSWRVIEAREIIFFPVVLALMKELCKEDAGSGS